MSDAHSAVQAASSGNRYAFADLIRAHQDMAFGYALSILGDYHAAEDATQEAFVGAYFGLHSLRDPAAFPSWLRGIVRHRCYRLTRQRRATLVPLDEAIDLADAGMDPEEHAKRREIREGVLGAVTALPESQREVAVLYYIGDHSQREIAHFLDLPVTTVNNRLHAARQRLKGGLLAMVKDDLHSHALPDDFADRIGKVIAVRGPVIDAQFAAANTPELLDAVTLDETATLSVMQQIAEGRVRCVTLTATTVMEAGMDLKDTETVVQRAISTDVLREAAAILVGPAQTAAGMVETGIKALDLLCPLPATGAVGFYGPHGAGKVVVLGEVLRRLSGEQDITLLNFVQTGPADEMRPPGDGALPNAAGATKTFYLPVDDAAVPSSMAVATVHDLLQGAVYLSRAMVQARLYPAIDQLVSWSHVLTEEIVGAEHVAVARDVRDVLRRVPLNRGQGEAMPSRDEGMIATAERLRAYLTQPFFVAEPYTKVTGEYVPVAQTIHDCREILSGKYNHIPVEDFWFKGSLEGAYRP